MSNSRLAVRRFGVLGSFARAFVCHMFVRRLAGVVVQHQCVVTKLHRQSTYKSVSPSSVETHQLAQWVAWIGRFALRGSHEGGVQDVQGVVLASSKSNCVKKRSATTANTANETHIPVCHLRALKLVVNVGKHPSGLPHVANENATNHCRSHRGLAVACCVVQPDRTSESVVCSLQSECTNCPAPQWLEWKERKLLSIQMRGTRVRGSTDLSWWRCRINPLLSGPLCSGDG